MDNRKLRYGLIGAGSNAERKHLNNYKSLPNIELVSVCDVNIESAKRLAEKYHIPKVYSNYEDMLNSEDLDLVSVCTPNYLHAEISIYSLLKGVNVHCEKPLAINANEAKRIVEAKNKSRKKLMVGLNNRFTNEAIFLKKYIDEGFLGDIYKVNAGWIRRSGIPGRGTWFTNKDMAGGGVMIDLGVHYLDLALFLMGMPEPSYIAGSTYHHFDQTTTRNRNGYKGNPNGIFNVEDTATGLVGLKNGATINFEFSWASNIENDKTFIEILGTKGGATLINGELKIHTELLDTCIDITPKINPNIKLMSEFEHFKNCILSGDEMIAPAEHGEYIMEIVDHFYKAAKEQKPLLFEKSLNKVLLLSS
jgi:predicted dehydrogenase